MRTTGVLPTVPRMLSNLAIRFLLLRPCRCAGLLLRFHHKERETSMLRRRHVITMGGAVLAAPALLRGVYAETFPSRFVRLICPFPPGGAVDAAARIIAGRLSEM